MLYSCYKNYRKLQQSLALALLCALQTDVAFAAMQNDRWHMGIGDATVYGWVTVAVYVVALICALRQAHISKILGANSTLWYYLALFLLFLGINKQLDLQSWLTQTMKDAAIEHGWYAHRRPVQAGFIIILGVGLLITLISLRLFIANSWRSYKITWIGIVLLCTFILMRAASFHHFDIFINTHFFGVRMNVLLEIGALLLIILGTFVNKRFIQPLTAFTVNLKDFVEISAEGNPVQCPQCGKQPLSKPVDGRMFKCKSCGHKYSVHVIQP